MKKIIASLLVATAITTPVVAQAADGLDLGIAGYFKGIWSRRIRIQMQAMKHVL